MQKACYPLTPRWPGLRRGRSLVLPLPGTPFAGLAQQLQVDGLVLVRKREFHATVLPGSDSAALAAALAALPRATAAQWRSTHFAALDWRWQLTGERWLVARGGDPGPPAHSVIACMQQPAQATFRAAVAALTGTPLPAPFAHVTLYTHGDPGGIGLPDKATFARRRVRRLA